MVWVPPEANPETSTKVHAVILRSDSRKLVECREGRWEKEGSSIGCVFVSKLESLDYDGAA